MAMILIDLTKDFEDTKAEIDKRYELLEENCRESLPITVIGTHSD